MQTHRHTRAQTVFKRHFLSENFFSAPKLPPLVIEKILAIRNISAKIMPTFTISHSSAPSLKKRNSSSKPQVRLRAAETKKRTVHTHTHTLQIKQQNSRRKTTAAVVALSLSTRKGSEREREGERARTMSCVRPSDNI